jgi:serine O-acetyltransferase
VTAAGGRARDGAGASKVRRMANGRLAADLRHMTARWDDSDRRVVVRGVLMSPFYPTIRALIHVRASQWAWRHGLRGVAHLLKARAVRAAGVEVHPAAEIGPGLALAHGSGVVVGHEVVAGRDLVLFHGATLGHGPEGRGQPRVGDRVFVGAGAKILGPVTVGDGARIGANAVVLADVPPGQTVVGVWKNRGGGAMDGDS